MAQDALVELGGAYRRAQYEVFYDADYEGALKKAAEYIAALERRFAESAAQNADLQRRLDAYEMPNL